MTPWVPTFPTRQMTLKAWGRAPGLPPHEPHSFSVPAMSVEYLRQRGGDIWLRGWCGSRRTTAMGATACKRVEPRASGGAARAPAQRRLSSLLRASRRELIRRSKNKNAEKSYHSPKTLSNGQRLGRAYCYAAGSSACRGVAVGDLPTSSVCAVPVQLVPKKAGSAPTLPVRTQTLSCAPDEYPVRV